MGELSTSLGISANSNFMIWLVGKATYTAKIPSSNLKITRQVYLPRKTMMKTSLLSIRLLKKFSLVGILYCINFPSDNQRCRALFLCSHDHIETSQKYHKNIFKKVSSVINFQSTTNWHKILLSLKINNT